MKLIKYRDAEFVNLSNYDILVKDSKNCMIFSNGLRGDKLFPVNNVHPKLKTSPGYLFIYLPPKGKTHLLFNYVNQNYFRGPSNSAIHKIDKLKEKYGTGEDSTFDLDKLKPKELLEVIEAFIEFSYEPEKDIRSMLCMKFLDPKMMRSTSSDFLDYSYVFIDKGKHIYPSETDDKPKRYYDAFTCSRTQMQPQFGQSFDSKITHVLGTDSITIKSMNETLPEHKNPIVRTFSLKYK